ncbi:MAG: hypothetical protein M3008_01420 [Chloroflexota bacterium]|nr:hypothetical protein [Chloroflexota bacterium]
MESAFVTPVASSTTPGAAHTTPISPAQYEDRPAAQIDRGDPDAVHQQSRDADAGNLTR